MQFRLPDEGYNYFVATQKVETMFDGNDWHVTIDMEQSRSIDLNTNKEEEAVSVTTTNKDISKALAEAMFTIGYWIELGGGSLFKLKELMAEASEKDDGSLLQ
jgi:galactitol-specific phosphotransferase system IIB component